MKTNRLNIPNPLGFTKAYAIFRDEAKKILFYGKRVEIHPFRIIFYMGNNTINLKVSDNSIEFMTQQETESDDTIDPSVERITKLFRQHAVNRYQKQTHRIFGTGLSRTGTSSLYRGLQILGIFGIHHAPYLFPDITEGGTILDAIPEYDAYIDTPFSYCFRTLDKAYPGSKFIFTQRDPESWVESFRWLMGNSSTPMSRWFYGLEKFDKQAYMDRFSRHEEEVLSHFVDRPDDLLVMNVGHGDGWDKLCKFLGKPVPDSDYPYTHRRQHNQSPLAQRNEKLL